MLSFDPDAAGQGAAAKSSRAAGGRRFRRQCGDLPAGEDPDTFIRTHGAAGYGERLKQSQPYLEYLLDRAAAGYNLNSDEGRVKFLADMLPVAARIPDAADARSLRGPAGAQGADVTDEVVRAEIRKAGRPETDHLRRRIRLPSFGHVTKAEKGLIWCLIHEPETALAALVDLEAADLEELRQRDPCWISHED